MADCIQSIYQQESAFSYEIIVVDNNSGDSSRERITGLFSQVTWIDMNYNSGFARANNEAIRRSKGGTVLLLNADTITLDVGMTS